MSRVERRKEKMKLNKKILGIVLVVAFLAFSFLVIPAFAATTWTTTSVGTTVSYPYTVSLAIDGSGIPHVAYTDSSGNLIYASATSPAGNAWSTQIVASNSMASSPYVSLVLDSSGNPHISYFTSSYNLAYAYWNGASWTVQTVDSSYGGQFSSIALDSSGNPCIAFVASGYLTYTYWTGSAWSTPVTVDSTFGSANSVSLAFDQSGNPHISYMLYNANTGNYNLYYASSTNGGSSWTTQMADSQGRTGWESSLAFNPTNGEPAISYAYSNSGGYLKVATLSGSTWTTQIVDQTSSWIGEYSSLKFNSAGNMVVSYIDTANGNLKIALQTGPTSWNIQTIASIGSDNANPTSLALNANGQPCIAFVGTVSGANTVEYTTGSGSPFPMPEYAYGALIGLAACFAAVVVLTIVKKRQHQ